MARKQTRTSVMSVAGAGGEGKMGGAHVANLNRAKSFDVSCPLSRAAAPAQQGMLGHDRP